jgi:branched-chain amino acid transport system substrate-binding protein
MTSAAASGGAGPARPGAARGQSRDQIGHVSPRTGAARGFSEADNFIIDQVRGLLKRACGSAGRTISSDRFKDSQSSGSRAAEVASELILSDKVDLLIAAERRTPPTRSRLRRRSQSSCICTNCPWQPYFFGRKGDPKKGFTWTYLFFWGLEDVIAAFLALWDGAPTNKVVAGLFPNDADGNAWGDPKLGLPPALAAAGYKLIDPGRYQVMNNDFSADRGVQGLAPRSSLAT